MRGWLRWGIEVGVKPVGCGQQASGVWVFLWGLVF